MINKYKYMKRLFITVLACITVICAQAKILPIKDAKEIVKRITPSSELVYTVKTSEEPDIYIFNKVGGRGFVVIAAEDNIGDVVLGFSDEADFDYNNIPENLKWWLNEYQKQIEWARKNNVKANSTPKTDSNEQNVIVAPLLGATIWDQTSPFNAMCPKSKGSTCPTGCVATAMAQIMYYHKWPLQGKGSHTNQSLKSQTVNFSESVYDWANMLPSYNGSYTKAQSDAVALLMRDCGCAVDMQYSAESSGAYSSDVPHALTSYFDYCNDANYIENINYKQDWSELIISELNEKRPVLYSAADPEAGGHAFVCDGYEEYQGKNYFHFNFGWSGTGNGYFSLSVINIRGNHFTDRHAVVVGIHANNKIKVGNLYYNVLDSSAVAVTYPNDVAEYSGDIVIPTTTVIDGVTYNVAQIGSFAFSGCAITSVTIPESIEMIGNSAFFDCKSLTSISVSWQSPIITNAETFDSELLANVVLNVPAGTINSYSSTVPWLLFGTITDGTDKVEHTKLESFETGMGNYHFASLYFLGIEKDLPVLYRESKTNPNDVQIIVQNWGDNDTPLIIKMDKSTNKCQVPFQYVGSSYDIYGPVYVSDYPTVSDKTYDEYPCTYNPTTGVFDLYLAYTVPEYVDEDGNGGYGFGSGKEQLRMHGFTDNSMEVSTSNIQEQTDGSAIVTFSVSIGTDLKTHKYALFDYEMKDDEIIEMAQKMATGEVESKAQSLFPQYKMTLPHSGTYTFIAIGFDKDKEYQNYGYAIVHFVSTGIEGIAADSLHANSDARPVSLSGQIVNDSYKGVVILNGKKYLKK